MEMFEAISERKLIISVDRFEYAKCIEKCLRVSLLRLRPDHYRGNKASKILHESYIISISCISNYDSLDEL